MREFLTIKNGKYYVVISDKDDEGKLKKKWIATGLDEKGNKRAAENMMRDIVADYKENSLAGKFETAKDDTNNPLFADYILDWLEMSKPNLQVSTYATYSQNVTQ